MENVQENHISDIKKRKSVKKIHKKNLNVYTLQFSAYRNKKFYCSDF